MKTAIRLALALYPRWWRSRYGREMEALLEDAGVRWPAALDLASAALAARARDAGESFRRPTATGLVLIPTLVGTIMTGMVAIRTPSRYRSEAVVEIAAPNYIPTPPTLEKNRLALLQGRLMTQAQLEHVITDLDLYRPEREQSVPMPQITDQMREDIGLAIDNPGDGRKVRGSFRVSFSSTDPRVAQRVADRLATLFVEESTRDRLRELELVRLQKQEERLRRLIEIETAVMKARGHDERDAEVVAFRREYDVLALRRELRTVSSEYQAFLAETTAVERPREYFDLRDAPTLPATPIGPNRLLMIATGAAVGFAMGVLLLAGRGIGRSPGNWHATPSPS